MPQFGQGILTLALALSILGTGLTIFGERRGIPELSRSGLRCLLAVTFLVFAASGILLYAFISHDFSFAYVSGRSSSDMELRYVLTAFYGGQAGSLLFWTLVAGVLASIAYVRNQTRFPRLVPWATVSTLAVLSFLLYVLTFVETPFAVNHVTPAEGRGLNPLLRDPGMLIHPPMLLAGFASFVVPFSIVVAALYTGRMTTEWLAFVRRWALVSWAILSAGIFLGGWWAYRVIGWGGYWAWDPVENVSLLPWLTVTAFIHSIMVQERRGMLKAWNVGLILASFGLSILGTFIVRSGLITSVHSFALSDIGPYFLGFLLTILAVSAGLMIWRLPLLRSEGQFESVVSREAGFLVNNLLFTGIAFATLWGTLYPLVTEAFQGTAITAGVPFYNQVNGPMLLALLLLMGIGPLLAWRKSDSRVLLRALAGPLVAATLAIVVILLLFGQPMAAAGAGAGVFAFGAVVVEYLRGAALRRKNAGESLPVAVYQLSRRDPRRYGGYVVHAGVAVIAIGIVGSWFFQTERQVILSPGESVEVAEYTLTYTGLETSTTADSEVYTAYVDVQSGGSDRGTIEARRFFYRNFEDQPTTSVGIETIRFDDVYVLLLEWSDADEAHLRIFINPMVNWIWAGGAVYLLGMVVLFWPPPRVARVPVPVPARQGGYREAVS